MQLGQVELLESLDLSGHFSFEQSQTKQDPPENHQGFAFLSIDASIGSDPKMGQEAEGMMLQVDGSPHDWLEGRGPSLCLVGAIDDATGKVPRAFFEQAESSWAYFRLFSEIFKKQGLCQSVYSDRHSIFWTDREPTIEEQLKNQRPTTEVGRGLEELGVTLILAPGPTK